MCKTLLLYFSVAIVLLMKSCESISWLGLHKLPKDVRIFNGSGASFSHYDCLISQQILGLRRRQAAFCHQERDSHVMFGVFRAARNLIEHCPNTFSDRRWNCSSISMLPNLSPELQKGTREQAIIHAYSAAALIYEFGRLCSENVIKKCSCGLPVVDSLYELDRYSRNPHALMNQRKEQFYQTGCSDNVRMAKQFLSRFLGFSAFKDEQRIRRRTRRPRNLRPWTDRRKIRHPRNEQRWQQKRENPLWARQSQNNPMSNHNSNEIISPIVTPAPRSNILRRDERLFLRKMNVHNYMAGIALMERNQKSLCKCVGMSTSCVQKICFKKLLRINDLKITQDLKKLYVTAKMSTIHKNNKFIPLTYGSEEKELKEDEIVFSDSSPDYCNYEPSRGSPGTHGRLCSTETVGTSNCNNMCCGRNFANRTTIYTDQCRCKADISMKIICEQCQKTRTEHFCL